MPHILLALAIAGAAIKNWKTPTSNDPDSLGTRERNGYAPWG
jgi:hypothetical protein